MVTDQTDILPTSWPTAEARTGRPQMTMPPEEI
jgi:hypothetical protein